MVDIYIPSISNEYNIIMSHFTQCAKFPPQFK